MKNLRFTSLLIGGVIALSMAGALPAMAQTTAPANGTEGSVKLDKTGFAAAVASSNQLEITTSKLALTRARSPEVKAFAQQMITDHTKAGQAFMTATTQDGVSVPDQLSPKHASMVSKLESAPDADFDAAYIDLQTAAHSEAVSVFRSYADAPDSEPLASFAKATLPELEEHLAHVKTLKPAP